MASSVVSERKLFRVDMLNRGYCVENEEVKGGKEIEIKKRRGLEFITYGSWECRDDRGGRFDQIA